MRFSYSNVDVVLGTAATLDMPIGGVPEVKIGGGRPALASFTVPGTQPAWRERCRLVALSAGEFGEVPR